MKRFLVVLVCLFLAGSLSAEAVRNFSFTYNGQKCVAAFDTVSYYVEYEDVKFKTLSLYVSRKNPVMYFIVAWKDEVYIFEDARYYTAIKSHFTYMFMYQKNPSLFESYVNGVDSLISQVISGKAGNWNYLGRYDEIGGFHPNRSMIK